MSGKRSHSIPGDSLSNIKIQGYLEKHGKLPGSFMAKKYWCVLDDHRLSYYKQASKSGACSGFIDVSKIQSVLKTSKGHSFNVLTHSGTQTFVASSSEQQDQWVKALQDIMTIAGRRRDSLRMSVVNCMSTYEANSDDEVVKVMPTVSDQNANHSTPSPPSADDKNSANDEDDDRHLAAGTAEEHTAELLEDEDVVMSTFSYANAADVAEALQSNGVPRVKSVASEEDEDVDTQNNPLPCSDTAVPVVETVPDLTAAPLPEIFIDSTPQGTENRTNSADVESRSPGYTPANGDHVPDDEREMKNDPTTQTGVVPEEKSDTTPVTSPRRAVVLRRESRAEKYASELQKLTVPDTSVVEVHIDTDFKPTVFSDFELECLSSDSGSAVEKLRQFLEYDNFSSHHVPTAIQPGKAFDSLKYFLSTLD